MAARSGAMWRLLAAIVVGVRAGGCPGLPEFPEPPVLRSSGGVLAVELELGATELDAGSFRFVTRAFNGHVPGPTLALRPGDVLKVTLRNHLGAAAAMPPASGGAAVKCTPNKGCTTRSTPYAHPNATNLHTHGLHVSPLQPGDNVLDVVVPPGGSYNYSYRLPPDHSAGLLWYHPHLHRSVALQTAGGAAGAIIVEGSPAPSAMVDRLLVLQTVPAPAWRGLELYAGGRLRGPTGGGLPPGWRTDQHPNNQHPGKGPFQQRLTNNPPLVNGRAAPTLHLRAGQWQRWRLLHAGAFFFMDLSLEEDGGSSASACELRLLATDGIPLPAGPRSVRRVLLAPAGRADVAVRCPGAGTLRLASGARPGASGLWNPDVYWAPLVMHVVALPGCAQPDPPLPALPAPRPAYLRDLRHVHSGEIGGRFNLTFADATVVTSLSRPKLRFPLNGDASGTCTFNGRIFNRTQPLTGMRLDTVQEWRVSGVQGHPFHTHVNPYQVVELWGGSQKDGCDAEYGAVCVGDWHDTLQVPDPTSTTGATLRFVTDRFKGEQVVHCHYLNHEDLGCIGFASIDGVPEVVV